MIDQRFEDARNLILQHGWNSTCYQLLNPGIELWFCSEKPAVVGYVLRKGVRVVAGAPVCAEEDLSQVVSLWEADALRHGHRVCYFGAEGRLRECLRDRPGYSTVSMGAQPIWNPQNWESKFSNDRSLRAQRNRAMNKGLVASEWLPNVASNHPKLRTCLVEWLQTRGLPPMHFLVEPETLGFLEGRRIFVAEFKGKVAGFLVLSPVPERKGWLTEQFPRGSNAPNGTVEVLMDLAMEAVAKDNSEYATMGIVPLSLHGLPPTVSNPPWLKVLMSWVRAHGRRFYNFDGLDCFKSKFHPDMWEPIFVISKERRFSLRSLAAIAAAFSDRSPTSAILRGLGKAFGQECIWLLEKTTKSASHEKQAQQKVK